MRSGYASASSFHHVKKRDTHDRIRAAKPRCGFPSQHRKVADLLSGFGMLVAQNTVRFVAPLM